MNMVGYALLGSFAGMTAGLLGIGGGLIVVPGLVYLYHFTPIPQNSLMQMAAGTSLAVMIPTTLRALRLHIKYQAQVWPIYARMAGSVILGAISGAFLAHWADSAILQILFGFFLLYLATSLWLGSQQSSQVQRLPGRLGMNIFGFTVGFKSGLLGIGGGVLTIPLLSRWGTSIKNAIATSNAVSFTVAVIGTMSFILSGLSRKDLPTGATGYVYWPAVLPLAIVSMLVAPWGVKLAHRLSPLVLKRIFSIFLMIVAVQMLKVLL